VERGFESLLYDTIGAVKPRIWLSLSKGAGLTSNQLNFTSTFDNNDFNIDIQFDKPSSTSTSTTTTSDKYLTQYQYYEHKHNNL